jgi:hypothetical protein
MTSGDIVNLRLARKRLIRAQKEAEAKANRAESSVPVSQRRAAKAQEDRRAAVLSGHRLEPSDRHGS